MEAKIQIIQRLLDERHITAKEALVLMEKEKEYIYTPWPTTIYPTYITPYTPFPSYTTNSLTINSEN